MNEVVQTIVTWEIYIGFGVLTLLIIAGLGWLSLFALGRILKFTGYWKMSLKALAVVAKEERERKKK